VTETLRYTAALSRDSGRKSWGDEAVPATGMLPNWGLLSRYADLEPHQETSEENTAYIAFWLEVLNDNRHLCRSRSRPESSRLSQPESRRPRKDTRPYPVGSAVIERWDSTLQ
jgi:hypothetical protein